MQVTPSRVVAFFTPVFAAGGAALTPWIVKYTGLHVSSQEVTALAITGATSATAMGFKFLHGQSAWERQVQEEVHWAGQAAQRVEKIDPALAGEVKAAATGEVVKVAEMIADTRPDAFPSTTPVGSASAPVQA